MATGKINLTTLQYVRINSSSGELIVEAITGDIHIVLSEKQPSVCNVAFHKLTDRHRLTIPERDDNVWALAKNSGSHAVVTEYPVKPNLGWVDVAEGNTDLTTIKKFGRNAAVGTIFTPICLGGFYRSPQASGATTLRIKAGGNANDDASGTGARSVTLVGLNERFEIVSETINTAGASASSVTTATFTRLYRAYVETSGTYATQSTGSHAASITIENGAGTEDWTTIDATDFPKGQSEIGAFSVPAGKTAYIKRTNISVEANKTIDAVFFVRESIDQTSAPYSAMLAKAEVNGVEGGSVSIFGNAELPLSPIVGPADCGWLAKTSTGTAKVAVEFEIYMVDS